MTASPPVRTRPHQDSLEADDDIDLAAERSLLDARDRLVADLGVVAAVDAADVEDRLRRAYASTADARVQAYRVLLAERSVRAELRRRAATVPQRPSAVGG